MSSRAYSATVEHRTNRPISSVQRSNRKLCSSGSNSSSKIRSFPQIFLGTFENAASGIEALSLRQYILYVYVWCLTNSVKALKAHSTRRHKMYLSDERQETIHVRTFVHESSDQVTCEWLTLTDTQGIMCYNTTLKAHLNSWRKTHNHTRKPQASYCLSVPITVIITVPHATLRH